MFSKWWVWFIFGVLFAMFLLPMFEGALKSKKSAAA